MSSHATRANNLQLKQEKYIIHERISLTDYSLGVRGEDIENHKNVFIKLIQKSKYLFLAENEVSALKMFDHPYIVPIIDTVETIDNRYFGIVMPLHDTDLLKYVYKYDGISERVARNLVLQLLSAIRYLHSNNIIHRNISPSTILISDSNSPIPKVSLTGFSVAARVSPHIKFTQILGCPFFWSPEVMTSNQYSFASDMWALGVTTYYILSQRIPFNPYDEEQMKEQILSCRTRDDIWHLMEYELWDNISIEAKNLIVEMMDPNPNTRITAEKAISHQWLQEEES